MLKETNYLSGKQKQKTDMGYGKPINNIFNTYTI